MRSVALAVTILCLAGVGQAMGADAWNLPGEQPRVVEGKVVDILCELAHDCPAHCGAGKRQLGILTDVGELVMAAKGGVLFAGPVLDLLPYCGHRIQADGLWLPNPTMHLYFVQYLRSNPSDQWQPADAFIKDWTARNGPAEDWQRADPHVQAEIAKKGKLGIPGLAPQ